MIIYGGLRRQVEAQFLCSHDWVGPFMDDDYRWMKCRMCFCVDRDTHDEEVDWLSEHVKGLLRAFFVTLHELECVRKTRASAMDLSEERRKQLWKLEKENTMLRKKLCAVAIGGK